MQIEIINQTLSMDIFGFGDIAVNKEYTSTAFKLSDRMWAIVKSTGLKNKGKTIWVYDNNEEVFAGVELDHPSEDNGLELKKISFKKYAYHKHIGPYSLIKQAGINMSTELKSKGYETTLPYIEIYGHWTDDETKLETELFMSLL